MKLFHNLRPSRLLIEIKMEVQFQFHAQGPPPEVSEPLADNGVLSFWSIFLPEPLVSVTGVSTEAFLISD